MEPYSFRDIHDKFSKLTKHVVLYLPRTSDLRQIAECVEDEKKAQIVHYCTNGRSRALCAYMGEWEIVNA
jgi:trimethylguanosine synthase